MDAGDEREPGIIKAGDVVNTDEMRGKIKLCGPRAVFIAIILTATTDYFGKKKEHKTDAALYFSSRIYRHHITLLGLPDTWLPEGITNEGLELQRPLLAHA